MNLLWVVIIVLILVSLLGVPGVGYWHHGYGWAPSGVGGLIVLILVILLLTGRL
jgi:uncharacterized membrane protein